MTSTNWACFNSRPVFSKYDASQSTKATSRTPMPDDPLMQEETETACLKEIEAFFRSFGVTLPKEKAFRYACFHGFDAEKTIEHLCMDTYYPYLQLKMGYLEEQFQSNTLFPIPYLRARDNTEVIYMRPSPFFKTASKKKCDKFVQSLCYVLNDLSQTKEQCRNGVTVIADMQNMNQEKFNRVQFKNLIRALEGEMVPTRVGALIIVSPPLWFGRIWKWMKHTMTRDFAKRVHLIHAERLPEFLKGDYQMYLPDEFFQGLACGSEISEDYIDLKMMQERRQTH